MSFQFFSAFKLFIFFTFYSSFFSDFSWQVDLSKLEYFFQILEDGFLKCKSMASFFFFFSLVMVILKIACQLKIIHFQLGPWLHFRKLSVQSSSCLAWNTKLLPISLDLLPSTPFFTPLSLCTHTSCWIVYPFPFVPEANAYPSFKSQLRGPLFYEILLDCPFSTCYN